MLFSSLLPPPFFSKTFRKTLSGNTFQNPQVKKISEVLFLVFFYVLPDFAKRHVHVYPPCLVNASFALVACLQATIVVAWLLETRRSSRPRLYTPLNTANSHGKSLFLPGKYHQHGWVSMGMLVFVRGYIYTSSCPRRGDIFQISLRIVHPWMTQLPKDWVPGTTT